jgi:hypothetical protein
MKFLHLFLRCRFPREGGRAKGNRLGVRLTVGSVFPTIYGQNSV